LQELEPKIRNFEKGASQELSEKDASVVLVFTAVAMDSRRYWPENIGKWAEVLGQFQAPPSNRFEKTVSYRSRIAHCSTA